ncbi:MAG: methionyl-tRNA formyltransferase [Treponema sp.]|nr:methionyl-tRNA formyltransferase [Treponema sp.]
MRVLFAASPAIAIPSLEALCKTEGVELAGVLTNPDTSKGRHGTPLPTEIGEAAEKICAHVSVLKPHKLDAAAREQVSSLKPELLVTFAYGRIFGPKFLALFPLGGINIHPSLLPKYRGPSPIQAAILNRDTETGITVQTLAQEMDSGDILTRENLRLTGSETAGSLGEIMAQKAAVILPEVLKNIAAGKACAQPQDHSKATYCSLFTRDNGLIGWKMSAAEIEARIRAFYPWPLCRTIHGGRELYILKAEVYLGDALNGKPGQVVGIDKQAGILIQTGDGILAVTELQYQGKKALFWRDFLNGARDFINAQLGS